MQDKIAELREEQIKEVCERTAFRERLTELGYSLSGEDFNHAFVAFKELEGESNG